MSRRTLVAFIIVVLFLMVSFFAILPFAAELYAGRAVQLESARRLDSAMAAYKKALRLDPLNARYYRELGRLYLKKTRGVSDTGLRASAREAYAKAIELSPTNSRYRLGWAEAEALLLADQEKVSDGELASYVENLKKAVEFAPNSYYVNTTAGYYLLLFRDKISDRDKNFAIYRMRYALELNPDYANQIFSYIANGLGDFNLLYKITPQTPEWQMRLRDFLRNINKWKYRRT